MTVEGFVQTDNGIGGGDGGLQIVRDIHDGFALFFQSGYNRLETRNPLFVNIGFRFIEKKVIRIGSDGTRKQNPLKLASGELADETVFKSA